MSTAKTHPLCDSFKFYYTRRDTSKNSAASFKDSMQSIASFDTVERFWHVYSHLIRPDNMTNGGYYFLFRENVDPLWEHEANVNGGKFALHIPREIGSHVWEDLILAFIGGKLNFIPQGVAGISYCDRTKYAAISIWNCGLLEENEENDSCKAIEALLGLENFDLACHYKVHKKSIQNTRTNKK
eukprot:TRINITY_DN2880_c0_g3_i1.p1 TRINITY_DN2880_c0_g3~~TRINITY_DN2880_c0_g3_i1.p1  ORF type:complete len:184 (+),score=40.17 TRINITY_DN2880_c0_g3_i1:54-605(+)